MPINRILIREHALCESLADYNDGIFILILAVEVVEIPTGEDRDAERGKESGGNDTPLSARILFALAMSMTVCGELQTEAVGGIAPRDHQAECGPFHAW